MAIYYEFSPNKKMLFLIITLNSGYNGRCDLISKYSYIIAGDTNGPIL